MAGNRTKNTILPLDNYYKPSQVTLQMGFWNTDLVNLSVISGINDYTSVRDSVNKCISNNKIQPLHCCFWKYVSFAAGIFPTHLSSLLLHPSVNQCHTLKVIRYLALPQWTSISSLQPTGPMTRNEMLRVSVRCEHVLPLKPQSSIVNTCPPPPLRPKAKNSSDGRSHSRAQILIYYLYNTVLYKIGKIGVLQCMSFLIFSFHLSEKYTMVSSPLPLAVFDGATTNTGQKVTYAVRWHVWNRDTLHGVW